MPIEPFIKCTNSYESVDFYTKILDFTLRQAPDPDPSSFMSKYAYLEREGSFVHISAHAGDGEFGNIIYVRVTDVESLYKQFINNGIESEKTQGNGRIGMHITSQSWGMKEFTVVDPDGNKITFGEPL